MLNKQTGAVKEYHLRGHRVYLPSQDDCTRPYHRTARNMGIVGVRLQQNDACNLITHYSITMEWGRGLADCMCEHLL